LQCRLERFGADSLFDLATILPIPIVILEPLKQGLVKISRLQILWQDQTMIQDLESNQSLVFDVHLTALTMNASGKVDLIQFCSGVLVRGSALVLMTVVISGVLILNRPSSGGSTTTFGGRGLTAWVVVIDVVVEIVWRIPGRGHSICVVIVFIKILRFRHPLKLIVIVLILVVQVRKAFCSSSPLLLFIHVLRPTEVVVILGRSLYLLLSFLHLW
jgi:hypothetical protein